MTTDRPISALIGALGGQGGGVLVDWLVTAAKAAGYPAQATSTPGVAQRTGATTYLFEIFPDKSPSAPPLFALFPGSDDIDLMAALEPTEAGRALEKGFVTARTTVITATERSYSTAEKVAAGDGTVPARPVLDGLEKATAKLIALPMKELTGGVSPQWNAVLFGAIAGSGVFPLSEEDCRNAIRAKGVAVDQNLSGFEQGIEQARAANPLPEEDDGLVFNGPPPGFDGELGAYPETVRPIVGHALARLVDYQDVDYARDFLTKLETVRELDNTGGDLTGEVAKRLAAWMSFEDVIRVAQLKTRPGRLDRIRGELKLKDGAPLNLRDYFKPGYQEIAGALPSWISWVVPKGRIARAGEGISIHWPTSSAWGFAGLKVLASFKGVRRGGAQFAEEHAAIGRWLDAIRGAADKDQELAIQIAKLAIWARGYGMVRNNGIDTLDSVIENWADKLSGDLAGFKASVDQSLILAHANPDADIH